MFFVRETWLGGYVRRGKKGPTYVIERWVGGEHFHLSTRCKTERAALKQLERFEADPRNYSPLGEDEVPITKELVLEFARFMKERKRNSPDWIAIVANFLTKWMLHFNGRCLKTLSLQRDVYPKLDEWKTSRKHRIEALKGFCTWLRQEKGLLKTSEDRTLDLPVPQSEPAKHRRRRAVPDSHVLAVLPHLPEEARDVLILLTGTAWHISEVRRFAVLGEIVRPHSKKPLAVLVTPHKSGSLTRTPITTEEHLEAAERVRARGRIPIRETLVNQMRAACDKVRAKQREAGVPDAKLMPHFRMGVMRHSVLTWAVEQGATYQEASEFANHRSVATTRKFYVDVAEPTVSVPVLRLLKPAQ